jgi:hypothetical protein
MLQQHALKALKQFRCDQCRFGACVSEQVVGHLLQSEQTRQTCRGQRRYLFLVLLKLLLLLLLLLTHFSFSKLTLDQKKKTKTKNAINSESMRRIFFFFFFLLSCFFSFIFSFSLWLIVFLSVSTGGGGGGGAPSTPTLEGDAQQQRDANTMTSPASSAASSPGGQVVVADTPEAAEARLLRYAELHRDALIKGWSNISICFARGRRRRRRSYVQLTRRLEKKMLYWCARAFVQVTRRK